MSAGPMLSGAMILAAGRGERMRPLTDSVPKPLLPVGGRPLIAWHLERFAKAGVRDVVINLAWCGERLREVLGTGESHGLRITYSDEGSQALETGGGIFRALRWLGTGPFVVINGDVWTDWPLRNCPLAPADLAHLVLVPNPAQHPRGDFSLAGSRVGEGQDDRVTFSGIAFYRPEFFAGCTDGAFPLLPLLRRAITTGRVSGELYTGRWHDIGTPERLARLDRELSNARAVDGG